MVFLPNLHSGSASEAPLEVKGSSKMATGLANQNCSFHCKEQPPYGGGHFQGRITSRVGRRIEFLRDTSKVALNTTQVVVCENGSGDLPIDGVSRSVGLGLSRHWLLLTWRKVWDCKQEAQNVVRQRPTTRCTYCTQNIPGVGTFN